MRCARFFMTMPLLLATGCSGFQGAAVRPTEPPPPPRPAWCDELLVPAVRHSDALVAGADDGALMTGAALLTGLDAGCGWGRMS